MRSEAGTRVRQHESLVQHDVLDREGERSSSRHRVARIDREVRDHLLELSRIGARPANPHSTEP
jgi:hypothetical protein